MAARDESAGRRGRWGGGSPVEWGVGIASGLLVAAMIGFVGLRALTAPGGVPQISVSVGTVQRAGEGFLVAIEARNDGPVAAAEVTIRGELRSDGAVAETSRLVLDYLPANSVRRGGLIFSRDPRDHELAVRAEGYRDP